MSTAVRRGQQSLKLDLARIDSQEAPPIAALFLIYFDVRAGYTLGWRKAIPGVKLEGAVEFKSLPSGLHHVKEDLIYFVHEQYVGVSAFINEPVPESERNALMLAVGVLVPLSYGRLGRGWRHADKLRSLARQVVTNTADTTGLEEYWELWQLRDGQSVSNDGSPLESPSSLKIKPPRLNNSSLKQHGRHRSISDAGLLAPVGQLLSSHHPALSLSSFLDTFGPLIFPLHRAALLRKRILLVSQAPVELACNYVYDLSILSNIPLSVNELLSPSSPSARIRPLFAIGVHDIPFLIDKAEAPTHGQDTPSSNEGELSMVLSDGWVACTTDDVLGLKRELYDILVTLPPKYTKDAAKKAWPKIIFSSGIEMRATQRDLRRYRVLRERLMRYQNDDALEDELMGESTDDITALLKQGLPESVDDVLSTIDDKVIEPQSWAALAYSSFMWWASAGEARQDMVEEEEQDQALFENPYDDYSSAMTPSSRPRSRSSFTATRQAAGEAASEMVIIAYFHRLTTLILTTLADLVDSTNAEDDVLAEGESDALFVSSEDMVKMGLDVWSESDRVFVEQVVREYFGRMAEVQGGSVECCGVKVAGP